MRYRCLVTCHLTCLLLCNLFLPATSASAQVDSTLIRVKALGLETLVIDSPAGKLPVFYSADKSARAQSVAELMGKAAAYLQTSLGVQTDLTLALLSEEDWHGVWPFPYGLPYVSLQAPWVVVMPADPASSVLYPGFTSILGEVDAATMIDNIGFHEVGHVYISAYLYPETLEVPPLRWLDEFLAQYLAYAFMKEAAPDRAVIWDTFTEGMLQMPGQRYTSLDAFEAQYYGYLSSPEGSQNYGWYQSVFADKAASLFEKYGVDFLTTLKQQLDGSDLPSWNTDTAIEKLESIAPGFKVWQKNLK